MPLYDDYTAPGKWVHDAVCKGRPELMEVTEPDDETRAKRLCRSCPVMQQCGTWVMDLPKRTDPDGVVAGMNRTERAYIRRKLTRQRRLAKAKPQPKKSCQECGLPKPHAEFYVRNDNADNLDTCCKTCRNAARTRQRREAREKANA